jgi:hypothetical protein
MLQKTIIPVILAVGRRPEEIEPVNCTKSHWIGWIIRPRIWRTLGGDKEKERS